MLSPFEIRLVIIQSFYDEMIKNFSNIDGISVILPHSVHNACITGTGGFRTRPYAQPIVSHPVGAFGRTPLPAQSTISIINAIYKIGIRSFGSYSLTVNHCVVD
ncbi:MAG: hypothetical protein CVU41_15445 [Chloroflexi bacterium HGW-Chloroflexi-3]|nr:MAG: hypothetical protein CVU41_15445 [Chloroflexi bacterium HGW-Chloroflexi-3]